MTWALSPFQINSHLEKFIRKVSKANQKKKKKMKRIKKKRKAQCQVPYVHVLGQSRATKKI